MSPLNSIALLLNSEKLFVRNLGKWDILCSDNMSQVMPFLRELFFTLLWRTTKNSGRAGSRHVDRLLKITKWKRNKNLKMSSFCAVFNCSNRADREKGNSNYRFPTMVKNNCKEVLKFSKVRREEWLAQISRKYLTKRKLERTRTRIKIILSASPSSIFSHKVHNIWKAITYSVLTNGNWTWAASTRALN